MSNKQAQRNSASRHSVNHATQAIKRWAGVVMKEALTLSLLLVAQVSLLMVVTAVI